MILECGPKHDRRTLSLALPNIINLENKLIQNLYNKVNRLVSGNEIGILISGGIDSAILYFLLIKENMNTGNRFNITPFTMLRKEGSRYYANGVINWIHSYYGLPTIDLNLIGDNTLPEIQQVESAVTEVLHRQVDYVYLGIIESRPEHSINWTRHKFKETFNRKYPFLNLQKSHVIDLYIQFNLFGLLQLTHSCAINEQVKCGYCNGCNERAWGLQEMNIFYD